MPIPAKFEKFLNQDGTMKITDYCDFLGIRTPFTDEDIKRAYRGLAKECHPDKNGNSTYSQTVFQAISDANDKLSDPSTRDTYLRSLGVPRRGKTEAGDRADHTSATYDPRSTASQASAPSAHTRFYSYSSREGRAGAGTSSGPGKAPYASASATPAPFAHKHFSPHAGTTPLVKLPCVISITKIHASLDTYNAIFRNSNDVGTLSLMTRLACSLHSDSKLTPFGTFKSLSMSLTSRKNVCFQLHQYDTLSEIAIRPFREQGKVVFITGALRCSDDDQHLIVSTIKECERMYSSHALYTVHVDDDTKIHLEPFSPESFERAYAEKPVAMKTADILGLKLLKLVGDHVEQSILSSSPPSTSIGSFFTAIGSAIGSAIGRGGRAAGTADEKDYTSHRPK